MSNLISYICKMPKLYILAIHNGKMLSTTFVILAHFVQPTICGLNIKLNSQLKKEKKNILKEFENKLWSFGNLNFIYPWIYTKRKGYNLVDYFW